MTPHLTIEQIERDFAGTLSPSELIALHDHIAECTACREACSKRRWNAASALDPVTAPDLRRFLHELSAPMDDESEHLSYEQLVGHVEGMLSDVDREITDSHLELCPMCARERASLAEYVLTRQRNRRQTHPVLRFWRAGALLAAAAVLVLMAVFVPGAFRRLTGRGSAPRVAVKTSPVVPPSLVPLPPIPRPSAPSVADTRLAKALTKKDQEIQQLQAQVWRLRRQKLPLASSTQVASAQIEDEASAQLRALRSEPGALMGSAGSGSAMRLKSPVGEIVLSDRPSFQWTIAKDEDGTLARYYIVQIWDPRRGQARPIATSPRITDTSWRDTTPLPRETTLRWQAKAYLNGGEFLAAAPTLNGVANFQIIGLPLARQIAQRHTDLARVYSKCGLTAKAQGELGEALEVDPNNRAARALLKKTKALMP